MGPFANILKDPPPAYAFELSESGIAFAKIGQVPQVNFQPFEEGVLSVSPVRDNIQRPEVLAEHIEALAPAGGARKRRAALILPDYCARVAVLDFDSFPAVAEEQRALIRFRMRKTLPFDVESAMVSYYAQPKAAGQTGKTTGKIEVLAAVVASEIVLRYEGPFRAAGFVPGFVTTSAIAMLNMLDADGVTLVVKLNGRTLTAVVLDGAVVKLVRCVEITDEGQEEMESVILPTMAYIEDELSTTPKRILLCGLGLAGERIAQGWAQEWSVPVETVRSRYGAPGPANAGLLGYLESIA
jgi:type IV pilus assembly protein PilM